MAKKHFKNYKPREILRDLAATGKEYFPQAADVIPAGGQVTLRLNYREDVLTEKELLDLWAQSGDALHRLSISKYYGSWRPDGKEKTQKLIDQCHKLINLLNFHATEIRGTDSLLVTRMISDEDGHPRAELLKPSGEAVYVQKFGISVESDGSVKLRRYKF